MRAPVGRASAPQRRVADGDVIAVAVAAVGRDHDVGPEVRRCGRRARLPRRRRSAAANDPGRRLAVDTGVAPVEDLDTRHAEHLAAARSSASRTSPSGVVADVDLRLTELAAGGADDDRLDPAAVAWASTEPQPNVSSSGWATVRSSLMAAADRAGRCRAGRRRAASAAGSGGCGAGSTGAGAGSPTVVKKWCSPPSGAPCGADAITSMRGVSVSTRNVWTAPRGTNANVPAVARASSPSTSNSISPSST